MALTTTESIQQLYVAYFNRPAEPGGLQYWVNAVNGGGTLTDVSTAFSKSPEYTASFAGLGNDQIITQIYQNLFNRAPDSQGLSYWSGHLTAGTLSLSYIVDNISSSAVNNPLVSPADTAAVINKTAAAVAFTNYLNTDVNLRLAYSTPAAGQIAKDFIHTVTDATTLAAATSATALAATTAAMATASQPVGTTSTLTVGQDAIVGTSANDTINTFLVDNTGTVVNTLKAFDSIDGGAGTDTLNLAVSTGVNVDLVGTVKNVENINITGSDVLAGKEVKAGFFAGAQTITVDGVDTDVTGVTAEKIVFTGAAVANSITYGATVAAGNVGVTAASGTITVGGAKLATVNLTGSTHATSGTPDLLTLVDATGTSTVTTLNVALTNDSKLDITSFANATAINASASTGGIELVGTGTKVASVQTGAGDDIVALNTAFTSTVKTATVTTGAGDDAIVVNTTGTGTFNVNAGAGDDRINLSAVALVAGDKVDGGDGVDTLVLNNIATPVKGDYVLINGTISNVETLEFANVLTSADGSQLTQFKTLTFNKASTITSASELLIAHDTLTASAVGYVAAAGSAAATYAGALDITTDATGKTITANGDTAVVHVTAGAADVAAVVAGDLKTSLTIQTVNSVDDATDPTVDTLASATVTVVSGTTNNLASLTSVVLTGNGSVTIDNSNATGSTANAATKLVNIDSSALGGNLTIGTVKAVTGGLTFTGNSNVAETIKLGAGADVLTLTSTYNKLDTVSGFDFVKESDSATSVVDHLTFGGTTFDGLTASAGIAKLALVAADSSLDLAFTHAAAASNTTGKIVQFVFEGNTYLFKDGGTAGSLDTADAAIKLVGTVDLTTDFGVYHAPV
jgi:hypothetical protein